MKKEKKKEETKKESKFRVNKTINSNTMTSSMFFSWLRSSLRKLSMRWRPINECRRLNRIPYIGTNKRMKWSYICEDCKGKFSDKEVNVHHLEPAGTLRNFEDLPEFCRKLFCEVEGLILVCSQCHDKRHEKEKEKKEIENKEKEENE